jgi:hypothetical protein
MCGSLLKNPGLNNKYIYVYIYIYKDNIRNLNCFVAIFTSMNYFLFVIFHVYYYGMISCTLHLFREDNLQLNAIHINFSVFFFVSNYAHHTFIRSIENLYFNRINLFILKQLYNIWPVCAQT